MASVLFVSGTSLQDHAITCVERVQHDRTPQPLATHCALLWGQDGVEAAWPRVRYFQRSAYDTFITREYPLLLDAGQELALIECANACVGDRYDLAGLLLAFCYVLTGRPQRWLDTSRARIHCSEMITNLLRRVHCRVLPGIPADNVTPAQLEQAVRGFHGW